MLTTTQLFVELLVIGIGAVLWVTRVFAKLGTTGRRELAKAAPQSHENLSAPLSFDHK